MEETKAEAPHPSEPGSFLEEKRILATAAIVLVADIITKQIVVWNIQSDSGNLVIVEGFFRIVNWHNTGAAFSILPGKSVQLALVSVVALICLIKYRKHFEGKNKKSKIALGLLIGGIVGNLIDRIVSTMLQTANRIVELQNEGVEWARQGIGKQTEIILRKTAESTHLMEGVSPGKEGVVDFIRFYLIRSDGTEIGYPAFNIADMGICIGVGLLFLLAWSEGAPTDEVDEENPQKES